jgi:hypothetical protein
MTLHQSCQQHERAIPENCTRTQKAKGAHIYLTSPTVKQNGTRQLLVCADDGDVLHSDMNVIKESI